jgi:putative transposase
MGRKHHTEEEIIGILRAAEVVFSKGGTIEAFWRDRKITEASYYRWRKIFGGVGLERVKKLKDLEAENRRLRRAVSDLTVDNQILKEVAWGNF